ncbi:cobalt/nickel transport system ATP-binding protein [Halanaerobium congolense]|uniref:ABC transporter ATP-binding protein n=2 Tax=Halanaerobium TaxID=2330 RepID=A0A1G6L201_9FIRM|nr:ATP-binding cassette domain-containing protein [Halanaerobium congolense]PTX15378.1 cobalt/nickel transport system ATP-binding protein [Halanaerobium congolense]PXV64813.1 cobalt/nickel transport system ATP-binding protein [Halanaerobium congolense]TDP14348.1 cobalt/nickel transport system ATP-binding protein [Halanaerobium congolense]TDS35389.1 cobalt/nickel transport system ATP-binding protein [Halanaerobium congolense]SDC37204.1 cobalt/nickel transport system ATP-binding protein [Halanae
MSKKVLEVENLVFNYPDGTNALDGLSLSIEKGKKIAILGANGAGKSTLFLHLNGILKPKQGNIKFRGKKISYKKKELQNLRKNIGIVFQDPDMQLFSSSVFQEISFGPLNLGLSEIQTRERVDEAMQIMEITDIKDKPTHLLSYGQKKRISIADILAMKPELIIFDEPTVWLDPKHSKEILGFINQINKKGTTVILSTHDVDLAYQWADYIYIFSDGKIIGEGSSEKIFRDNKLLKESDLIKPWIIEVYEKLIQNGRISSNVSVPKSKSELFELI